MSLDQETRFELDPRLAKDTAFITDWRLSRLLLMDDVRFPWLILVPRRAGACELDDLDHQDQAELTGEINHAMALLREVAPREKLNVGALGNIVRQLHVHVVARHECDAAWPGPVWGCGSPQRYAEAAREALVDQLRNRSLPDRSRHAIRRRPLEH